MVPMRVIPRPSMCRAAPIAWAASSTIFRLCRRAMARMRSISHGCPAKCTGSIALTRLCRPLSSASSMRAGLMLKVPGSTSTKTGFAPRYPRTSAVAVKVNGVVITSSPGPMPSAHSARCSAPVQCETASACFAPTYCANSVSKRLALGPVVIHPERRDSITSCSSSGPIEGRKKGTSRIYRVVMLVSIRKADSVGFVEYKGQGKTGAR